MWVVPGDGLWMNMGGGGVGCEVKICTIDERQIPNISQSKAWLLTPGVSNPTYLNLPL